MSQQTPGKRAGRVLMVLAWCAALFLATRFFGQWEERQQNPNVVVSSEQGEGFIEVKLVSNAPGAFRRQRPDQRPAGGFHARYRGDRCGDPGGNGRTAETGKRLRGDPEHRQRSTEGYRTRIDRLQLGDIVLRDVRALVVPGLDGKQVLLGMSALNKLEFTQRGGTMLLRQTTNR